MGFEMDWSWYKYYYRVIGYGVSFAGAGLIADELINGKLQFWPPFQHEIYGVILAIIGLFLISKKPKGKDRD